jgi:PPOX class probable F420-dependent enzyme
MYMLSDKDQLRLRNERNLWLATVRPNGTPHLVPIWYVWLDDKAYLCTAQNSVKARNIAREPRVVFALQDGDDPIVIEAHAQLLQEIPARVIDAFQEKFTWDIRGDATYNAVVEITPTRVVL